MRPFREHHLFKILALHQDKKTPLDMVLRDYFLSNKALGSKDRRFLYETLYKMIRWRGLLDYFCTSPITWEERYLRLSTTDIEKCVQDLSIPAHIRVSFPKELFSALVNSYGEEDALALCKTLNTQAPTTLRANLLKTSRDALLKQLAPLAPPETIVPAKKAKSAIHVLKRIDLFGTKEFKDGFFEVQDEASQLVADLMDPKPGDWVLDFCSGSGGKTLAFAHKMKGQGQIFLHDIRPHILTQAKKRMRRAGVQNYQMLPPDRLTPSLHQKMDWILVDAPCSGSGTLRRNPDQKWKFSCAMLERLLKTQKEILEQALPFLKPGGHLVYATCSLLNEENEEQITSLIETQQEKFSLKETSPPFRSLLSLDGDLYPMDGFFASRLLLHHTTP